MLNGTSDDEHKNECSISNNMNNNIGNIMPIYNDNNLHYINKYSHNLSTTDSSSFDSSRHVQLIESGNSNSMINNNVTNDDDSDINSKSDCPIYHNDNYHSNHIEYGDSLQNKLLFLDDFSRNYLDLRNEYIIKKNKINKDTQLYLNQTKQKITKCFY
eukprot:320878_1